MNPIIIIPGIMGSRLYKGENPLWVDIGALGGKDIEELLLEIPTEVNCLDCLRENNTSVSCPYENQSLGIKYSFNLGLAENFFIFDLIGLQPYNQLKDFLVKKLCYTIGIDRKRGDLFVFPYDWRLCNRISSRRLASKIEEWQEKGVLDKKQKITIIAHSMGGLVARDFIENLEGYRKINRLIMIGTPNHGAVSAFPALVEGKSFPTISKNLLKEFALSTPSSYQLLPDFQFWHVSEEKEVNIYENKNWIDAKYKPILRNSRFFNENLGHFKDVEYINIIGYDVATQSRVLSIEKNFIFKEKNFNLDGDGTVLNESALLKNTKNYYVREPHLTLPRNMDTLNIIKNILQNKSVSSYEKKKISEEIADKTRVTDNENYETTVQFPKWVRSVDIVAWLLNPEDKKITLKPCHREKYLHYLSIEKTSKKRIYPVKLSLKEKGVYRIKLFGYGPEPDPTERQTLHSYSGGPREYSIEFFVVRK